MNSKNMSTKSQLSQLRSIDAVASTAPNVSSFGESISTLFRWKKSIYKLVWKHMLCYFVIYIALTVIYVLLDEEKRKNFRAIAQYCSQYTGSINLMIMLGFFTSTAMQRLFSMQTALPGTARSITVFIMSLKPDLPEGPAIIEQFARWQILSWILTFRTVCRPLRVQYPDLVSLQTAGFLNDGERLILEYEETRGRNAPRPLVVLDWMLLLLKETHQHERFFSDFNYLKNVDLLLTFKKSCGNLIKFSTQNIPHSIIQAVILSVYSFGMVTLLARNFKDNSEEASNATMNYFPLLPGMQFFVYLAWLSFGRAAVNPFGEDDDDIDVKLLLETHVENSLRIQRLYSLDLQNVFLDLPQREFNEAARL